MKSFIVAFIISALFSVFIHHQAAHAFSIYRVEPQQQQQNSSLNVTNFNGTMEEYLKRQDGNFTLMANLLNATKIPLGNANVTLFAPNDQAFQNLPQWIREQGNETNITNSTALPAFQALMMYHIHLGRFSPKNLTGGQDGGTAACTGSESSDFVWGYTGGSYSEGKKNVTSLSTALRPLNLTIYQAQQNQTQQPQPAQGGSTGNHTWWVNDARIVSVANTTTGYIFELSRVVTPMYYFNSSIYDVQQAPPRLPSNYTSPQPVENPQPVNLSRAITSQREMMQAMQEMNRLEESRMIMEAFGF